MKAVVQDRYGPPEVLRIAEVTGPSRRTTRSSSGSAPARSPRPTPTLVGADPFLWRLAFGLRRPRWRTLGVELAGEVEAVGSAVSEFKVGDEVFGQPSHYFGAHAEYVCAASARRSRSSRPG